MLNIFNIDVAETNNDIKMYTMIFLPLIIYRLISSLSTDTVVQTNKSLKK